MKRRMVTYSVLTLAIAFTTVGIITGQPASVVVKAIRICLECVGIG